MKAITTKKDFLKAVKDGMTYYDVLLVSSASVRDDEEIMLNAVEENGVSLKFASDRIKDDKGIVLVAVENAPHSVRYASERLQDDKCILSAALKAIKWMR